jgi:hypothetical protein
VLQYYFPGGFWPCGSSNFQSHCKTIGRTPEEENLCSQALTYFWSLNLSSSFSFAHARSHLPLEFFHGQLFPQISSQMSPLQIGLPQILWSHFSLFSLQHITILVIYLLWVSFLSTPMCPSRYDENVMKKRILLYPQQWGQCWMTSSCTVNMCLMDNVWIEALET